MSKQARNFFDEDTDTPKPQPPKTKQPNSLEQDRPTPPAASSRLTQLTLDDGVNTTWGDDDDLNFGEDE